ALVDWESGLTLGTIGGGMDIDLAAAGNTNVVRAKFGVMRDLGIDGGIEDILITLTDQYHMIRLMDSNPNLFIYLALDRSSANLGMARHQLSKLEKELSI
ncbi:MAG: roadblock/LC7 domain-containing protein, partial [Chloroflexota bacterium]